ncbi:MAG: hypothetical protein AB1775_11810 [Bacteroidota bacterium]
MRFKLMIISILTIFVLMACSKKEEQKPQTAANPNVHQILVQEAIQVSGYTYIHAKEGDKDYWIAASTVDTKPGETLYYEKAMEMKNFESKELKRKFDSILFVDNINKIPPVNSPSTIRATPQKPTIEKQNISVDKASGGVTVAQLFGGINNYANKTVTVKGKVVKVNNGIMNKNWVHIQDGTSNGADYDLTVTTNETLNVGDVVTLQGTVAVNKDFGYGYSYKVLLEDAKKL